MWRAFLPWFFPVQGDSDCKKRKHDPRILKGLGVCVRTYACMHACMHACMYICMHIYIYTHKNMYINAQGSFRRHIGLGSNHKHKMLSDRGVSGTSSHALIIGCTFKFSVDGLRLWALWRLRVLRQNLDSTDI